jgi:hypothetical protein
MSIVSGTFRSAQAGLLPHLVENPKQLTSANATAEIIESTAQFAGPAIAGILLGLVGIVPVVLLNAVGLAWSLIMVAGVQKDSPEERKSEGDEEDGPFIKEAAGGFAAIGRDRDLLALSGLLAVNGILCGVLNIIVVLIAAQMLGDANKVGLLNAVLGAATFGGGFIILGIAGRVKLGRLMVFGVLGWCLPLILVGLVPLPLVVIAALILIGLCDPMINVGFGTIPPRLVADRILSRVFAAIESMFIASAALGAFVTPILVNWLGLGTAIIVMGIIGAAVCFLCALRIPHLDKRLTPPRGLSLLEKVDLFRPLAPAMLDRIAHKLEPATVPAGEVIVAEGGVSDRFYVIESGEVDVTQDDRHLRTESVGDVFGEIGLLRDVPRTATVTAETDTVLLTLSREDFLELVSSDDAVRGNAQELATRRLVG